MKHSCKHCFKPLTWFEIARGWSVCYREFCRRKATQEMIEKGKRVFAAAKEAKDAKAND
jgi:hypothetical protein